MNPFDILGIEPTLNLRLIQSGYQHKLSRCNDDNVSLIEAYDSLKTLQSRYTHFVESGGVVDISLNRLAKLIDENNLGELEALILLRKRENRHRWDYDQIDSVVNAFRDAILAGNEQVVDLFLNNNVSPNRHVNKTGQSSCHYYSLLSFACEANNLSIVKKLVDAGADIKDDNSAISIAVMLNLVSIVHFLLEQGANANAQWGGYYFRTRTLLLEAAKNQNRAIIQALTSHQASINHSLLLLRRDYNIRCRRLKGKLNWGLYVSDTQKAELESELTEIEVEYSCFVKVLLDYAVGTNLTNKHGDNCFNFIANRDVSGHNFIGVSFNGKPATPSMLIKQGCTGVEQAIFSVEDLDKLGDPVREKDILNQLQVMFEQRGELVNEGIVNLIPLVTAIESNDTAAVESRLNAGGDPNVDWSRNIVVAARKANLEIASLLIESGRVDKKAIVSAIVVAEENNNNEIIELLASQLDINDCDEEGNTLLHKAVERGDLDKVKELVANGAEVNIINKNGQTPLIFALVKPHYIDCSILEFLLTSNANPNLGPYSALQLAVSKNNPNALRLLIKHVDKQGIKKDRFKQDPLILPWFVELVTKALGQSKAIELLTILRENGADFRQTNYRGQSVLYLAVSDLLYACESSDSTDAVNKHFALLQFLVENGADFGIANDDGSTPLLLLIKNKDLGVLQGSYKEVLAFFVNNGANPMAKDKNGRSMLYYAAQVGDITAIDFLIERGANINEVSAYKGRTPLHAAACAGKPQTCKHLIELGADETRQDSEGLTPVQLSVLTMENNTKSCNFRPMEELQQRYREVQRVTEKTVSTRDSFAELMLKLEISPELSQLDRLNDNASKSIIHLSHQNFNRVLDKVHELDSSNINTFIDYIVNCLNPTGYNPHLAENRQQLQSWFAQYENKDRLIQLLAKLPKTSDIEIFHPGLFSLIELFYQPQHWLRLVELANVETLVQIKAIIEPKYVQQCYNYRTLLSFFYQLEPQYDGVNPDERFTIRLHQLQRMKRFVALTTLGGVDLSLYQCALLYNHIVQRDFDFAGKSQLINWLQQQTKHLITTVDEWLFFVSVTKCQSSRLNYDLFFAPWFSRINEEAPPGLMELINTRDLASQEEVIAAKVDYLISNPYDKYSRRALQVEPAPLMRRLLLKSGIKSLSTSLTSVIPRPSNNYLNRHPKSYTLFMTGLSMLFAISIIATITCFVFFPLIALIPLSWVVATIIGIGGLSVMKYNSHLVERRVALNHDLRSEDKQYIATANLEESCRPVAPDSSHSHSVDSTKVKPNQRVKARVTSAKACSSTMFAPNEQEKRLKKGKTKTLQRFEGSPLLF